MNPNLPVLTHAIASTAIAVETHDLLDQGRVRLGPPGRDWAIVAAPEGWHVVRVFERGTTCSCSRTMNTICAHVAAALTAWAERATTPRRFDPETLEQLQFDLLVADLEAVPA